MPKTLQQVIDGLQPEDGRRAFWVNVRRFISEGKYELVWELIGYHDGDDDYEYQCRLVTREIEAHKASN